jgi:RNA polymerase sigma factor (sigma-70 family)
MNYKPFLNEETRSSVLAGVRAGSEEAWGRFFDLYAGYVFSLARRAGLLGEDADDLVQTVFSELSAPGGFDGYERGKGSFRAWLRQRVLWRVADALRRRASAPPALPLDDPDAFPAPGAALDEDWIEAARAEALRRLRESVSSEHFAIFQASVIEELPTEDVMRIYRVSRDNLYQIRKRTKDAFAALLRAALDDLDAPLPPA